MDRRKFLVGVAVAAPTLTVTGRWVVGEPAAAQVPGLPGLPGGEGGGPVIPGPTPSDFYDLGDALAQASAPTMVLLSMSMGEDGRPSFKVPRQEVGQGLNTMCAMFIAEELGLTPDQVDVSLEDARFDLVANQLTGGSYNARALYQPVSKLAAGMRTALLAAAAREMGVSAADLSLDNGRVVGPTGAFMSFGQLSPIAAAMSPEEWAQIDGLPGLPDLGGGLPGLEDLPLGELTGVPGGPTQQLMAASRPQDPAAKPVSEHTVLGTRQTRLDARDIATGQKRYAIDLDFEDCVPTVALHSPRVRSALVSFDNEEEIRGMPGVIDVATIRAIPTLGLGEDPNLILDPTAQTAIVIAAETFGHAIAAQEAVQATWTDGPVGGMSDQDFADDFRTRAIPLTPGLGDTVVDLEIDWAHYAHAPMETMDAVCRINDDGSYEIFAGHKIPQPAQQEIAEQLLMLPTQVTVHCVDAGGSFGRRLFHETSLEAAMAAQAFGRSVKLMWTRDQDTKTDRLKPACLTQHRMVATGGVVTELQTRYTGGETNLSHGFGDVLTSVGAHDPTTQIGVGQSIWLTQMSAPYNFGLTSQLLMEIDYNMLTGSWRSVYTQPGRGGEEMIAELMADALGEDPIEFRIRHAKSDRLKEVCAWIRDNGDYGRSLPAGVAQGFAANSEHRGHMACLVEVDTRGERPKVTRAVMASDNGIPFNPSGIEGQMLGGLNDAIATALQAGIHIDDGAVRESSFSDYFYTRAADFPRDVTMHVFPAREGAGPSGFGEGMVPTCLGAIANALFHATGTMPTRFPINF